VLDEPLDSVMSRIRFDEAGLVPAIVQQAGTGRVLMMAWMDRQAFGETFRTRRGTYYSRSRDRQWVKGETSGNTQDVQELHLDCDGDTVLVVVEQHGVACHTGALSCFEVEGEPGGR
jgi:phosphoribosyl-AMP cyclohydrolase